MWITFTVKRKINLDFIYDVAYICVVKVINQIKNLIKMTTQTNIVAAFKSLVNGNTHIGSHGIVGTKHEVRNEIWEAFRSIYNEGVTIKIKGEVITLKANHSLSRKSTSYFGIISKEAFENITGSTFGLKKEKMPYVTIQGGKVQVNGGGNFYVTIENSSVEII
jgi:hypothetical protein